VEAALSAAARAYKAMKYDFLIDSGNPGKLIEAARAGSLTLYASAPLLAELHGVLGREKFTKHLQGLELTATQILEGYAALTTMVVPGSSRRRSLVWMSTDGGPARAVPVCPLRAHPRVNRRDPPYRRYRRR
jgi:hypothetical protein